MFARASRFIRGSSSDLTRVLCVGYAQGRLQQGDPRQLNVALIDMQAKLILEPVPPPVFAAANVGRLPAHRHMVLLPTWSG